MDGEIEIILIIYHLKKGDNEDGDLSLWWKRQYPAGFSDLLFIPKI